MMAGTPTPAWKPLAAVPRGTAWNLHREREVEFADQVLAKFAQPIGRACTAAGLPRPAAVELRWARWCPRWWYVPGPGQWWVRRPDPQADDSDVWLHIGDAWPDLHADLGLDEEDPDSDLWESDFLFRLRWPDDRPPLLLIGAYGMIVHTRQFDALAADARNLAAAGH